MPGKQIHSIRRSVYVSYVSFNYLISTIFFIISVNSLLNILKDVSLRIAVTFKERDCTLNAVRFQYIYVKKKMKFGICSK